MKSRLFFSIYGSLVTNRYITNTQIRHQNEDVVHKFEEKLAKKEALLATREEAQNKLIEELVETKNTKFEEMESTAEEIAQYKDEIEKLSQQCEEVRCKTFIFCPFTIQVSFPYSFP